MATFTINGTTEAHLLDALGIDAAVLRFQNQVADVLELEIEQAEFNATAWAYNMPVVLYRDTTVIFRGVVTDVRPFAGAQAEGLRVTVSGPYWQLSRIMYRQAWKVWDATAGEGGAFVDGFRTHVILGQNPAGGRLTNGEVIADALEQASDFVQVGTVEPDAPTPLDEGTDMALSEVVHRMLRWTPDCVVYFDYTTEPPTCHVKKAANLTGFTATLNPDNPTVRAVNSVPRYDLKMAGVIILYETTTTTNGEDRETTARETAGSPVEGDPLTLVMTVNLQGTTSTSQAVKVVTEEVPEDLNTAKAWWKARVAALKDVADDNFEVDVERLVVGGVGTPKTYELLDGSIPDWLQSQANAQLEQIVGTIWLREDGKEIELAVAHHLTTCDLQSGTRKKVSREGGEAAPTGLAASIWSSVGTLWHEGVVQMVFESPAANWMGLKVTSPTGGTGAVQVAEIDLEEGTVSLSFGPPKHISPADFIELARANRLRMKSTANGRRLDGKSASGAAEVQVTGKDPRHNSMVAPINQVPPGRANTVSGFTIPLPAVPRNYLVLTYDQTGWSGELGSGKSGPVWDVVRAIEIGS